MCRVEISTALFMGFQFALVAREDASVSSQLSLENALTLTVQKKFCNCGCTIIPNEFINLTKFAREFKAELPACHFSTYF